MTSRHRPVQGLRLLKHCILLEGFGLNLEGLEAVNAQANGIARRIASSGEPLGQAGPLTVAQIKRLEELTAVSEADADRVLFGGMVFMAYSCARVSDVARGINMMVVMGNPDDPLVGTTEPFGYIELGVIGNKGARSIRHKRSILPVVTPLMTLSGHKWWEAWLDARTRLGLENDCELQLPLISRFGKYLLASGLNTARLLDCLIHGA